MSINKAITKIANLNKTAGIGDFFKGYTDKEANLVKYYEPEDIAQMIFAKRKLAYEEDGFLEGDSINNHKKWSAKVREALNSLAPKKSAKVWEIYNTLWDNYISEELPKQRHQEYRQNKKEERESHYENQQNARKVREQDVIDREQAKDKTTEKLYALYGNQARKAWKDAQIDLQKIQNLSNNIAKETEYKELLALKQQYKNEVNKFQNKYNIQYSDDLPGNPQMFIQTYIRSASGGSMG